VRTLVLASILTVLASAAVAGPDDVFLKRPGATGQQAYDLQVAEAYRLLQADDLQASLTVFQKADAILLHEAPRFELLPQIAYLQHRLGQGVAARETLTTARLVRDLGERRLACPGDSVPNAVMAGPAPLALRMDVTNRICSTAHPLPRLDPQYLAKMTALEKMIGG